MTTFKLVRIKNHYHFAGEKCHHTGRTPNTPQKRTKSLRKRFNPIAVGLSIWALLIAIYLPFHASTILYQKAYAQDVPESIKTTETLVDLMPKSIQKESIKEKIWRIADEHNISRTKLDMIVRLESQYIRTAEGDMDIICKRTGKPVRARGPVQITECFHPEVSDKDAFDWEYSLNWAAEQIALKHCAKEWSTCRK